MSPITPPPGTSEHYEQELSRSLNLRGNVLITLSAVTPASSVFIIIPTVIAAVGGASFLAFLMAAAVAACMALCYAELSSAFPIAGGEYSFAGRVLGKAAGFSLFLMNAFSLTMIIGVIALGTGEYLAAAFDGADSKWVGVAVILVCSGVAILNIRTNAWITGVFLALEMAAIVVVSILGFVNVSRPVSTLFDAQTIGDDGTLVGVGLGLIAGQTATALFAYNGYGAAIYFAEETQGARKVMGKVILVCLGVTVVAEMLPLAAVLLGAPDLTDLVSAGNPMEYFMTTRGSEAVNVAVSLAIAVAIINATVAIILQGGRTLYSAARDRAFPDAVGRRLAYVHPVLQTPPFATILIGVVAATLAAFVPIGSLITATGATLIVVYVFVATSALVGRRTGSTAGAQYRMPLFPLPPLAIIVALAYVTYQVWDVNPWQIVIALSALGLGFVYHQVYLRPRHADRWTMLAGAPEEDI
ncbi:APC family permease [Aeromicrobium sp. Leaf350]|uniref:APC family permease n=1 Tax=Aeromicrobium sp. Leaf350 TaxID=2876565 RepID=UPI001E4B435F|nr:APC family permease [Aeromicrobium sp. Leaf350]